MLVASVERFQATPAYPGQSLPKNRHEILDMIQISFAFITNLVKMPTDVMKFSRAGSLQAKETRGFIVEPFLDQLKILDSFGCYALFFGHFITHLLSSFNVKHSALHFAQTDIAETPTIG